MNGASRWWWKIDTLIEDGANDLKEKRWIEAINKSDQGWAAVRIDSRRKLSWIISEGSEILSKLNYTDSVYLN